MKLGNRLYDRVPWWITAILGIWILALLFVGRSWLLREEAPIAAALHETSEMSETLGGLSANWASLLQLKASDLAQFKDGLAQTASAKKTFYEMGVDLHEEKRLLDKQWDILVTALSVDATAQMLVLEKDGVPVERIQVGEGSPVLYASSAPVQGTVRITSKERFAHPERGKVENVNGVITWVPPQVGTSIRSNALGEYVIFTDSPLILHGPPKNPADHEAYPHACFTLTKEGAKALYTKTYIGTRIYLPKMPDLAIQSLPTASPTIEPK